MSEQQADLPLDAGFHLAPTTPPELRDEIAQVWGLPIGKRVTVSLRKSQLNAVTGTLELAAAPEFPWNPRQPLRLRVAGCDFSSRGIEQWKLLEK